MTGAPQRPARVVVIGGGAAGLAAAYTLRKRGIPFVLLEAESRVGGRLACDEVDGFRVDMGAEFFCSSYDVTFRLCEELSLPVVRTDMNLGWYRNGRWAVTTPLRSVSSVWTNLVAAWRVGLLEPRAVWSLGKLVREIRQHSAYLSFADDSRLAELDDEESFGDYLAGLGAPESVRAVLTGFLQLTMGRVELAGAAYMRAYIAEVLLKTDQIFVPERGTGALADALADACRDTIRVSTPVRRVVIRGGVEAVITDQGRIEADAVICAVPASRVPAIAPDLPAAIRHQLGRVSYSTGCRVVIGLDRRPLPSGWDGALYPEDDTPLVLDRSINLPACAPPDHSMLNLLVGSSRAEELLPLDDEEIKRRMLGDVRRCPPPGSTLPNNDEGLFTRVYRWKEAVCMGPPGILRRMAAMRQQLGGEVKNLFLAGDYLRAPSVNGALASGVAAANEAVAHLASRAHQTG